MMTIIDPSSEQGKNWVMIQAVDKNWETWQKRMMDLLRPPMLLPFELSILPNEIRYDFGENHPLSEMEEITEEKIEQIFGEIEKLSSTCVDYWLDLGNFCRDPHYIFSDFQGHLSWIYEPSIDPEDEEQWKAQLYHDLMVLGSEKGWSDSIILKCYHRFRKVDFMVPDQVADLGPQKSNMKDKTNHPAKLDEKKKRKILHFYRKR